MSIDARALQIVEQALAYEDAAQRASFVADACGENAELRARVEDILGRDADAFKLLSTESFVRPISVVDNIPDRVGPFRITKEIARGGMGAVVKAERDDGLFEQTVAIKLIRGDLASDRAKRRFAEERRILARLRHPGIVRIVDGGDIDNRPWLAMDFIDGKPIDEALIGKTPDARLDAFEAVCESVAYAHRSLVVHADIKPSNILMDDQGNVHLLDFGIARLLVELDETEAGDPYPLTKGYAAPERGVGTAPTIASDVFSLGVLLLGMLGKAVPREHGVFVAGTRLPEGQLEGDLSAVVSRALAEDPAERYADVPAFLADIRRFRGFEPVEAIERPGWWRTAFLFARRHRKGFSAAALVVAGLLAATVISTVSYVRAERARAEADKRFDELRGLAQFMLTELDDRLSDAPGTAGARARIAEVAGHYLERLRTVPEAPLDLRLDTARGYRRLAKVQGLTGTSNLGQPDAAARSLDHAEALLAGLAKERPGDAAVLTEQGWVALMRWPLAADTEGPRWTARATSLFAQVLKMAPSEPLARLGQLAAQKNHGVDLINADRAAEAKPVLEKALKGLRAIPWPASLVRDARLLEVSLLARLGDATYYAGDEPGALRPYGEAEALIRAELARTPSLMWEEKLGEAIWNRAGTLGEISGREAEALSMTERGVAEMRRTLSFGPDAAIEMRLLILQGEQALLLDDLGRTGEAADVSRQAVAMREARLARAPSDPNRQRDLAVVLAAHADLLAKAGQKAGACKVAERGRVLLRAMKSAGHLAEKDQRTEIPKLEVAVARYCR